MPSKHDRKPSKADILREEGTLNPAPEKVRDPKFQQSEFFDPRDVVQVKYEMLRRVSVEKAVGDRRRPGVWRLEADLLPGQGKLRGGGNRGIGAQEARSTRPAQDPGRGPGIPEATARSGRADPGSRAGEADPAGIRRRGASQDDRAGSPREKNAAMTSAAAETDSACPSAVAAQYEILRMAALGEALPPEARSGLMLFLRRGMWGWARTLTAASVCEHPSHAPSPNSTVPCEREAVITSWPPWR